MIVAHVHVYYARVEALRGAEAEALLPLLSAEEHARIEAMSLRSSREEAIIARALARTALSQHGRVSPGGWRVVAGPHGKPELADHAGLSFNVTHTHDLVACAVSTDGTVGIDAERVDERIDGEAIASRFFAATERRDLAALEPGVRRAAFFELWTLKEAFAKGCGLGLHLPFDAFAFDLQTGAPTLRFLETPSDEEKRWRFARPRSIPDHAVAVAVRTARPLVLHELRGTPRGGFSIIAETRVG